jgi:hypothetical protein
MRHAPGSGSRRAVAHVGTRRAPAFAGRRRANRLRELVAAGMMDSFGLALGWTVFNLIAVTRGGLEMAALYNAAMLVGIVLSAPVTTWLAGRLDGRTLLRGAAGVEAVLRIGTLGALVAGWSTPVVAAGVVVMHLAAWTGYAAMRAEVAAVDGRSRVMTQYALSIAAVEAAGAGLATLVPITSGGAAAAMAVTAVTIAYGACLLPTLFSARRARVGVAARVTSARRLRLPVGVLAAGAAVALFASGPTLLSVALATELYGASWVAGAAIAFSAGCLLSSRAVDLVDRWRIPGSLAWPLWGVGMLVGWSVAPLHVAGLLVAQLLAGLSLTAFEGAMDARVARSSHAGAVTTVLAWSAASRSLGSAVAVRTLPVLVAAPAIGAVSLAGMAALTVGGAAVWAVSRPGVRAGRHRADLVVSS